LAADRPDLLAPVREAPDYLRVEVVHAASHEGALHLEDVLTRRTRISIEYPHRGEACAVDVADLMGEVLNWTVASHDREVQLYLARVAAERESQREPDDSTADARRAAAPDPRLLAPVS
jgi:glycerol-3-phosphate dehydrogenase